MNGQVSILKWVEDTIHPLTLTKLTLTESNVLFLKEEFATKAKDLKKTMFECQTFGKKDIAKRLTQLVLTSNTIHHYLNRLVRSWNQSASASQIKCIYIYVLNSLEMLLKELSVLAPKIYLKIPVTRYSLPRLMMEIKDQYRIFRIRLHEMGVEENLKTVLQTGLFQLIHKKEITLLNADYCRNLMSAITRIDNLDTQSAKDILFQNGFNSPQFFYYCINEYRYALANIPGFHEQLAMIITEQDKLQSLPRNINVDLLPGVAPINEQLQGFLAEKKYHINEMLNLRRVILQDDLLAKSTSRLRINMPVAQLGLFIRVQIEKGLLRKENIGELFNFFATHFYTPQTMFISADSLRKKSTDVEFSTAQKLKAHLIAMLNWLNENYNLSNYNGS